MSTHALIAALERIAAEKCAYDGSYDSCAEAEEDGDYDGTCAVCIARAALATHRAGTGEAHAFADCIKADGDKPCRDCAEYAAEAVGAPRESGGTLLGDLELAAKLAEEPRRDGHWGAQTAMAARLRGHAAGLRKLLETMDEIGPGAWMGDELRALALPPLTAAAIQESPGMKPGQRCTYAAGHHGRDIEHAFDVDLAEGWTERIEFGRCPYVESAPPPADVEVPQRRDSWQCPECGEYAGHKSGCETGDLEREYMTDRARPEAAPTCGTCKGAGELYFDDSGTMARGYMRPCPDCTAPRALQGEAKKP